MISCRCADVAEIDHVPGTNDEHAALLPGVALRGALALSLAQSANAANQNPRAKRAQNPSSESRGSVGLQFRVNQEGAFDPLGIAEVYRMLGPAVADDDQFGTALANGRKCVTQLRDLLAAEQSTEMADERQHHRAMLPQITETDGLAIRIEHDDVFQPFRDVHSASLLLSSAHAAWRYTEGRRACFLPACNQFRTTWRTQSGSRSKS